MSGCYYRLKPPVTSLRLKTGPGHDRLSVWVNHGLAGELVLPKTTARDVVLCFAERELDESRCPLRTTWDGNDPVVMVNVPRLDDDTMLVSEYGDLLTVAQVKARHRAKRKELPNRTARL